MLEAPRFDAGESSPIVSDWNLVIGSSFSTPRGNLQRN